VKQSSGAPGGCRAQGAGVRGLARSFRGEAVIREPEAEAEPVAVGRLEGARSLGTATQHDGLMFT
jgi:hypothetical protein